MIEAFYNLKKLPFQKDINTKDLFISKQASELSQRLEHIKQKRGIMLLTGIPGTGKTLHIRAFVKNSVRTFLNPCIYPSVPLMS